MRLTQLKKKSTKKNPLLKAQVDTKVSSLRKTTKKKNPRSLWVYMDYILFFALFFVVTTLGILWMQNYPQQLYTAATEKLYNLGISLGFRVQEIVVQGRKNTHQKDLMDAIKIQRGDPIFMIDLQQTRFRLEKLEWVRQATVVRHLPDLIHIKIEERHPIAIWQHHNEFHLVDDDGTAILTRDYRHYGILPLIVGEGAPQKSRDILKILNEFPLVQKNLQALSRVRERRWNVYLLGGVVVKLSDRSLKPGLATLEKLLKEQRLSVNNILEVDLRTPERYFLRVTPETINTIKNNKKGRNA